MFSKNDFMENTVVATYKYNESKVAVPSDLVINIVKSFDVYSVCCNYGIYAKGKSEPYYHDGTYTSQQDALTAFFIAWNDYANGKELDKWGFIKNEHALDKKAKVHLANGKSVARVDFDK